MGRDPRRDPWPECRDCWENLPQFYGGGFPEAACRPLSKNFVPTSDWLNP